MVATTANLLVMFGATGDLAQRMLLPALYGLEHDGLLPDELIILATARSGLETGHFRERCGESLTASGPVDDSRARGRLLDRIEYVASDLSDEVSTAAFARTVEDRRNGEVLFHLSTSPDWYGPVCRMLARHGLIDDGARVMLEKPIGHDLDSCQAINDEVAETFREDQVFRIDHYLGKDGVQNLLALRFGNALFEPLWNARHIEQVQITVAETIGVEGRADYYDQYGAMRDMVQNHLLQLLCLTAMEPPTHFQPKAVRNEKRKALDSLRPIVDADVKSHTVAGQYTAGAIDGRAVGSYKDEVGKPTDTETFVSLRAHIDNWRWSGVPFYLRTGKRMPQRVTEIYLQLRSVPHSIFSGADARIEPNALLIRLQPEESISLLLMNKTPGLDRNGVKLAPVTLDLDLDDAFEQQRRRIAYERLYLDALEANGTLFVRRDEVEAAWAWVDRIIQGWHESGTKPRTYPAGTWGPSSAVALTERHGHSWRE